MRGWGGGSESRKTTEKKRGLFQFTSSMTFRLQMLVSWLQEWALFRIKSCNTQHLEMLWKCFSLLFMFLCTLLHKNSIFCRFLLINPSTFDHACRILYESFKYKDQIIYQILLSLHLIISTGTQWMGAAKMCEG